MVARGEKTGSPEVDQGRRVALKTIRAGVAAACAFFVSLGLFACKPFQSSEARLPLNGEIKSNPLTFTFTGYRVIPQLDFGNTHIRREGAVFVIVYYDARNDGREPSDYDAGNIVLTSKGRKYGGIQELTEEIAREEHRTSRLMLQPGLEASALAVFQLPEAVLKGPCKLHVGEPDDYFGSIVLISDDKAVQSAVADPVQPATSGGAQQAQASDDTSYRLDDLAAVGSPALDAKFDGIEQMIDKLIERRAGGISITSELIQATAGAKQEYTPRDASAAKAENDEAASLLAAGKTAESIDKLQRALADDEGNVEYIGNMGLAQLAAGNGPLARRYLLLSLSLRPSNPEAWDHLAKMHEKNGESAKANTARAIAEDLRSS